MVLKSIIKKLLEIIARNHVKAFSSDSKCVKWTNLFTPLRLQTT